MAGNTLRQDSFSDEIYGYFFFVSSWKPVTIFVYLGEMVIIQDVRRFHGNLRKKYSRIEYLSYHECCHGYKTFCNILCIFVYTVIMKVLINTGSEKKFSYGHR